MSWATNSRIQLDAYLMSYFINVISRIHQIAALSKITTTTMVVAVSNNFIPVSNMKLEYKKYSWSLITELFL